MGATAAEAGRRRATHHDAAAAAARTARRRRRNRRLGDASLYGFYALTIIFFLFPVFWVVSMSLRTVPELFASPPVWIPADPQFANYTFVFQSTPIVSYLLNSLLIVVVTVLATLAVSLLAAYALSRRRFRGRRFSLVAILAFQLISPVVVAIPLYRVFSELDLINNRVALIAVYTAMFIPFTTWFLKAYLDTIPRQLDEAARLDGASPTQVLWRVLLPLAGPALASAAVLVAVQAWSQFVIPFILLDDRSTYPVSVGLLDYQSSADAVTLHYLAAATVIAVGPVLLLFAVLQRYVVGALTRGAVKG